MKPCGPPLQEEILSLNEIAFKFVGKNKIGKNKIGKNEIAFNFESELVGKNKIGIPFFC